MIPILLMILDLLALTSLTLVQFKISFVPQLAVLSSIYLIAKGFMFKDFMSIIDSMIGVYLILAFAFGISSFLYWIILVWFMYKLFFVVLFNLFNFS